MSEICLDCGADITGPKVLCELCEKRYVRCKHSQVEYHCQTCRAEARMAEAIRLLEQAKVELALHRCDIRVVESITAFLSANRGRG